HRRLLDLHRDAGADGDPSRAEGASALLRHPEERLDEAVLGPGPELEHELHASLDALDGAEQLVRDVEAEVVPALARREGERVAQPKAAGVGRKGRLEDELTRHVAPHAADIARWPAVIVSGIRGEDVRI